MAFPATRRLRLIGMLAAMGLGLLGAPEPLEADTIVLPQASGGTVALDRPAQRLVTLSPHLAELVFAAGAGDLLAATVAYSNHPPAAADLPRVGDAFRIDAEQIHLIDPDLVLAWQTGNPPEAVGHLVSLGFAVWIVEIRRPVEIADALAMIGLATGRQETANREAESVRARIAALRSRHAGAAPVRYFYQISAQPLYTVNGAHLISQALDLCGGENVFAGLSGLAPQVGIEAVLLADPALLLAPEIEGQPDPLAQWEEWPRLQAVSEDHRLLLPADAISRATPRFLDAVELACAMMDDLRDS